MITLFLDFDGVLHPARAVLGKNGPELRGSGALFMWADQLSELVSQRSDLQIVLSTDWVRHLDFEQVRDYLPVRLRRRVIGSTWNSIKSDPAFSRGLQLSQARFDTRYEQIKRWGDLYRLRRWVALYDNAQGWDESDRDRLVQTGIVSENGK